MVGGDSACMMTVQWPRPINKSSFSFVKMTKKRRLIGRITSWREARQRVKRMKATRAKSYEAEDASRAT